MTASETRWLIVGGVHLDHSLSIPQKCLERTDDFLVWADRRTRAGGVAANLARHVVEAGERGDLVVVVGDDLLSKAVVAELREEVPGMNVQEVVVASSSLGVVDLIYIEDDVRPRRLMIGPSIAPLDNVDIAHLLSLLTSMVGEDTRVLMDGYLLRTRTSQWVRAISQLDTRHVRINLELVPHSIWTTLDEDEWWSLQGCCESVSLSMSTFERILGLGPEDDMDPEQRCQRVLHCCGSKLRSPRLAHITMRFGKPAESRYAFTIGACLDPALREYHVPAVPRMSSTQDHLYVRELVRQPLPSNLVRVWPGSGERGFGD